MTPGWKGVDLDDSASSRTWTERRESRPRLSIRKKRLRWSKQSVIPMQVRTLSCTL